MPLAELFGLKLNEQVASTLALLTKVPTGAMHWHPELPPEAGSPAPLPIIAVLDHLQQSLAGVAATLYGINSDGYAHLLPLRALGQSLLPLDTAGWQERLHRYWSAIEPCFATVSDAELELLIPTVFRPKGEAVLTVLLGNLEHFINHKFQLFFYLKLLGAAVGTADLYQLR